MMRLASVQPEGGAGATFGRQIKAVHLLNGRRRREKSHCFSVSSSQRLATSFPAEFSLEQFFGLFKKAFADGIGVFAAGFGEFLQFGLLLRGQVRRDFDLDAHVQIAAAVALEIFHALALDPEGCARLRAGGDL